MTAERSASERGDRLASWLDDLGLGPHLAAAGLPTYVRGPEGRASWTDPRTGRPLDADQLEQLDRLLHREGTEPEHAVPVPLLLIARQARVREELLAGSWLTYEALAERRGATVNATRFAVHKAQEAHRLLVVSAETGAIVPDFQLTDAGELRPDLEPVLLPLLAAGMDPWRAWAWLTQPAGLLGGLVPERQAADPAEAEVVRHAALRLAERVADDA
jgi:hypothetical protein